jgi:hypothetical protein
MVVGDTNTLPSTYLKVHMQSKRGISLNKVQLYTRYYIATMTLTKADERTNNTEKVGECYS